MNEHLLPQLRWLDSASWSEQTRQWLQTQGIDEIVIFSVPLTTRFRSVTSREGLLLRGINGWGECSPFLDYGPKEASTWLRGAIDSATQAAPEPIRSRIPVNVTVPVGTPAEAARRVVEAQCATAKVKVADPRQNLAEDARRVEAVAGALAAEFGEAGRLRIDVNGAWDKNEACRALEQLNWAARAVGGLEYVEQPCETVEELAYVRRRSEVPVAADESIRRAEDPFSVVEMGAADLAVIKVYPLGGVHSALELANKLPIPVVVSSAIDTSVGLAAGTQLAAALPSLPYACGLDTQRLLAADVTDRKLRSVGGKLTVSDAAAAQEAPLVANAAVLDPEVSRRWVRRMESMVSYLIEEK